MNDKTIERVLDKLEVLDDKCSSIDKTLERNTASLEYHIKRTDLLEDSLSKLSVDLKPLENHVTYVNNIFKFLGVVGTVVAFGIGIYTSFKK